jgi:hypothetical protein
MWRQDDLQKYTPEKHERQLLCFRISLPFYGRLLPFGSDQPLMEERSNGGGAPAGNLL